MMKYNLKKQKFNESSDESSDDSEQENFEPGLHVEQPITKPKINNVFKLRQMVETIKQDLPWVERLDSYNSLAPLAPELAISLEKHEQKRASEFNNNHKLQYLKPAEDPVINDFKREMDFYRQAQNTAIEGIAKLRALKLSIRRPDDYFAEMAKSDDLMQKVRNRLLARQEGQAKADRIKRLRQQRIFGKALEKKAKVTRVLEKKSMLDNLKKFRKGKLKNLDFLDDNKNSERSDRGNQKGRGRNQKNGSNRNPKNGKGKGSFKGKGGGTNKRLGKSKRSQGKSKRK